MSVVSAMSTAANLPGELVELILKSLCTYDPAVDNRWKASSFDSSLGRCSLTCRHWATHIRPVLFRKVDILSEEEARAFAFFVRSSVAIPRPLRMVIRKIELSVYKTSDFRPWMYYIWALLRDIELPNLQEINLAITGTMVRGDESVVRMQDCDESLLDVGLPRTLPSTHPIRLRTLDMKYLRFHSYTTLLRSFTHHCSEDILCQGVQWPEGSTVLAPTGRLRRRLSSHSSQKVSVGMCTSISPFVWSLITTQPSAPLCARPLLYISTTQMHMVMRTLRLFSDECECTRCGRMAQRWSYQLRVYTDQTDSTMRCLGCGYSGVSHTLIMQIAPPGTVSRVCIVMEDAADFISRGEDAPSDQLTAAPVDLNSTLMRLDQLCESLGNQLRGVVIALFPRDSNRGEAPARTVETMRSLRVQMPSMTRRQRLAFRMSRRSRQDLRDDEVEYETALEHVFEHDGLYWANVALGEERPSPES